MAADTVVVQLRTTLLLIPVDSLVSSIVAGDVASAAANALLVVELRQYLVLSVQFLSRNQFRECAADELVQAVVAGILKDAAAAASF